MSNNLNYESLKKAILPNSRKILFWLFCLFILSLFFYLFNIHYTRSRFINYFQDFIFIILIALVFLFRVSNRVLNTLILFLPAVLIVLDLVGRQVFTNFISEVLFFLLLLFAGRQVYEQANKN